MKRSISVCLSGLGFVLGLFATVSGLRFLLKPAEDEDWNDVTTKRKQFERKLRVPKESIGAIIGRGGEMIHKLQKETGTKMNFEDAEDAEGCRTLVIAGTQEDVVIAESTVKDIVSNYSVEKILIPNNAVGFVIGKNGESIRQLCEVSGAKIKIPKIKLNGQQCVEIKGNQTQIDFAKDLINEKLVDFEKRKRKDHQRKEVDALSTSQSNASGEVSSQSGDTFSLAD